jgi:uncharacterized Ntn-hydrolase superfamily protein
VTFSIVARCAETGMFGVAVASSSPAVAARCAYARAGVGAAASQNVTDPRLGPRILDLMGLGATAPEAMAVIARTAPHAEFRQVLAIDAAGRTAIHSGRRTLGRHAEAHRDDAVAAGNLLADEGVPAAMLEAFETTRGALGDRILAAMQGALAAGGEAGPVHSAGMLLVREVPWPVADLRCDWTEDCPIARLAAAWEVYRPQLDAYVARALDPEGAPSYGVPGDE